MYSFFMRTFFILPVFCHQKHFFIICLFETDNGTPASRCINEAIMQAPQAGTRRLRAQGDKKTKSL